MTFSVNDIAPFVVVYGYVVRANELAGVYPGFSPREFVLSVTCIDMDS